MAATAERVEFQTEVQKLLDLIIHSLYSNKDIFLRELISNASDALDKLRFESITQEDLAPADEFHIFLEPNAAERTLSIADNGIGMSRDDVIQNIGTIAKSGTKEFLETLKEVQGGTAPPELIGQFGVGFYSSFMVADRVSLVTRKAGEEKATQWESSGDGGYTLTETDRPGSGTTVTLHLKPVDADDGMQDYTDEWVLKGIVKKYSDFVGFPIRMNVIRKEIERDEQGQPKAGAQEKTTIEEETLNSMKAIWTRPPEEVTEEEYKEFYRHISHDWNDPLKRITTKLEGTFEARALLFIPSKAPYDLYQRDMTYKGIQLYVRRVFIMDECKELMPTHLRFIKGLVDAEDLPLNVSREILQQDRQIKAIRTHLVKKVLETLKDLKETDAAQYLEFWKEFGPVLKEGLIPWGESKDPVLELILAESTRDPSELTSLSDYIARMKEGQSEIYYMTGTSRDSVEKSPHLETFKDKEYEVLILTEPVDEVWLQGPMEFQGKKFRSVGKGEVELGSDDEKKEAKEKLEQDEASYKDLLTCIRVHLQDDVKEVRLSSRLTSSPACLVGAEGDATPQLQEMMAQSHMEMPNQKRILELNPKHPILEKLQSVFAADAKDPALKDYAELLYGQAALAEGTALPDPAGFSKRVADLMLKAV